MTNVKRPFSQFNILSDTLRFSSLEDDFYLYTSETEDSAGTGVLLPGMLQAMELFKDDDRKFRGHVTEINPGIGAVTVRVDGPWYWMRKIDLSGNFTPPFNSSGTADDRHNYVFPQQGLATSLAALITKFAALGVPLQLGSIDTMFNSIQMSLPNMSCADALAEVLRFCPDAVAWFDYTGASGSLPILNISRRGAMTSQTFTVGTHRFDKNSFNIRPRTDLKLSMVKIKYVDRHPTTNKQRFQSQDAGTAVDGEIQYMTLSGPERMAFIPKDDLDSVFIKSSNGLTAAFVASRDGDLSQLKDQYGTTGEPASSFQYYGEGSPFRPKITAQFPPLAVKDSTGVLISTGALPAGKYVVTSKASLPDWAIKAYDAVQVTITGTWLGWQAGASQGDWTPTYQAWQAGAWQAGAGYADAIGTTHVYYFARQFSISVWMIDTQFVTSTEVFKPWDTAYATPPANLATNWLACQNWVPWDGPFTLVEDDLTLANLVRNKINVAGSLADCATMDALLRGITYEIKRGRRTFDLGPPARTDFRTAGNRVRQEPQGSFEYV